MKKSGFLLLVMALFLITTSVSAGGYDPSNSIVPAEFAAMDVREIKIDIQEEVAGAGVGEIDVALSACSIQAIEISQNIVGVQCLSTGSITTLKGISGIADGGAAVRLKYPLSLHNYNDIHRLNEAADNHR